MKSRDRDNHKARQAASELITNLRGLVVQGTRDDRLCEEAAGYARRAIDRLDDLARLFIDGYGSVSVASQEVTPTTSQWSKARGKVSTRVRDLKDNIRGRLQGSMSNMETDIIKLVADHQYWVDRLTIAQATL